MLNMGWKPGQMLGIRNSGLLAPIRPGRQTKYRGFGSGVILSNCSNLDFQLVDILKFRSQLSAFDSIHTEGTVCSLFDEDSDVNKTDRLEPVKSLIEVNILNEKVACLVDTGSDITCISNTFWESIVVKGNNKLNILPVKPMQIRGAVGQKSTKIQQMVLIPVNMRGLLIDISFFIVPNLIHPVILGFDWLYKVGATIQLQKPLDGLVINSDDRSVFIPFCESIIGNRISALAFEKVDFSFSQYLQDIKIGVSLSAEQLNQLKQLLNKYSSLFTKRLGRANCYEHDIKMYDHVPFIKRSYPIPYAYRAKMEDKLKEMLEMGIISRGSTPYSSPLTFTVKPDGSLRILLDAREINKYMIAESEAPPMQMDVLNAFHGVNYISTIDLNNAYFQIKISDNSKMYTGFTFNGRSYMYNVLPQGLKTSVESFSRAMDIILGPEVRQFCVNYLDDLAILTSGTLDNHLEHIEIILNKLQAAAPVLLVILKNVDLFAVKLKC